MRYVPYDASPSDKPPRMAIAVRLSDRPQDLIVCARLSAEYNGEEERAALVNAQQHVNKPRNALFVAVAPTDEVVGYARVSWVNRAVDAAANAAPKGYYLGGMVIDERFRRRGVGTRLTDARMKFIRARAPQAWYLVNQDNQASIDLHVPHGFHEATRDFTFPGVILDGPGGILCHARFDRRADICPGCEPG